MLRIVNRFVIASTVFALAAGSSLNAAVSGQSIGGILQLVPPEGKTAAEVTPVTFGVVFRPGELARGKPHDYMIMAVDCAAGAGFRDAEKLRSLLLEFSMGRFTHAPDFDPQYGCGYWWQQEQLQGDHLEGLVRSELEGQRWGHCPL